MNFPKKKEIEQALKQLNQAEGTFVIDLATASKSDLFKYQLCQEFVKFLKKEKIPQAELARRLKIDRAIVNKIILHRIQYFTIDRLIDLLAKVRNVEVKLQAS